MDDKYACVGMEDPRNGGKALYKLACRQSVHDKCREPPTRHPGPKTLTPAAPRASRLLSPPTARKTLRRRHESSIGVPEAPEDRMPEAPQGEDKKPSESKPTDDNRHAPLVKQLF